MAQEWADNLAGRDDCHAEHNPNLPLSHAENMYTASPTITAKRALNWWKNSPDHRENVSKVWLAIGAVWKNLKVSKQY